MRKILFLACLFALPTHIWAQKPKTYNYQIDNFFQAYSLVDFKFSIKTTIPLKIRKKEYANLPKNNSYSHTVYNFYPKNKVLRKKGYQISVTIEDPQVKSVEERLSLGYFGNVKDTILSNGDIVWTGEEKDCFAPKHTVIFKTVKASDRDYFFCFWVSCEDGYEVISKEEILKWVLACVIEEKICCYPS